MRDLSENLNSTQNKRTNRINLWKRKYLNDIDDETGDEEEQAQWHDHGRRCNRHGRTVLEISTKTTTKHEKFLSHQTQNHPRIYRKRERERESTKGSENQQRLFEFRVKNGGFACGFSCDSDERETVRTQKSHSRKERLYSLCDKREEREREREGERVVSFGYVDLPFWRFYLSFCLIINFHASPNKLFSTEENGLIK